MATFFLELHRIVRIIRAKIVSFYRNQHASNLLHITKINKWDQTDPCLKNNLNRILFRLIGIFCNFFGPFLNISSKNSVSLVLPKQPELCRQEQKVGEGGVKRHSRTKRRKSFCDCRTKSHIGPSHTQCAARGQTAVRLCPSLTFRSQLR